MPQGAPSRTAGCFEQLGVDASCLSKTHCFKQRKLRLRRAQLCRHFVITRLAGKSTFSLLALLRSDSKIKLALLFAQIQFSNEVQLREFGNLQQQSRVVKRLLR